jgi:methionyl-tRNA formyltransferase
MRLTAGLDSGPVCLRASEPIEPGDSYGSLARRLQQAGGALLIEALNLRPPCIEQDESRVTYAEKLTAQDRLLDPARPARELERTVRALHPHVGAAVILPDGARLGVWEARALQATAPVRVGELSLDGELPVLGCGEGSLELLTVQPAGKRAMAGADWARGRRS